MTWRMVYRWPARQIRGFVGNVIEFGSNLLTKPEKVVPPSVWSTWVWLKAQVPRAFGGGTPFQQITASVVLAVVAFLSGFITAGATWVLIGVFTITFVLGLLRLWPFIDKGWTRTHPLH